MRRMDGWASLLEPMSVEQMLGRPKTQGQRHLCCWPVQFSSDRSQGSENVPVVIDEFAGADRVLTVELVSVGSLSAPVFAGEKALRKRAWRMTPSRPGLPQSLPKRSQVSSSRWLKVCRYSRVTALCARH